MDEHDFNNQKQVQEALMELVRLHGIQISELKARLDKLAPQTPEEALGVTKIK